MKEPHVLFKPVMRAAILLKSNPVQPFHRLRVPSKMAFRDIITPTLEQRLRSLACQPASQPASVRATGAKKTGEA